MDGFDPQAPFIASDGLKYGCVADKILGTPLSCWRNEQVLNRRRQKESEESIRAWIEKYDGDDLNDVDLTTHSYFPRPRCLVF